MAEPATNVSAPARVLLAEEQAAKQDWREAIRLYSEAVETCGDCEIESTLHRDLGLSLCRESQIEQCADELHKALALNHKDRDAAKALEMIRAR